MASEIVTNSNINRFQQNREFALPQGDRSGREALESGNFKPVQATHLPHRPSHAPQVSQKELERIAEKLNELVQSRQHRLQFSLDDGSGRTVIKVINKETDEIIRQFPPDEILSLSRMIAESLDDILEEGLGLLLEARG